MKMNRIVDAGFALFLAALALGTAPQNARAEAHVSGLVDVVFKNTGENDLTNMTFAAHSPFDTIRMRLFADAELASNVSVFTQIFTSTSELVLYGAYIRFEEIAGSRIGAQVGLIPNTVGSFGERTYSDKSPLIGTPLMWVHHTTLRAKAEIASVEDLVAAKEQRTNYGLPPLYDNCWNSGAEVYTTVGDFDLSLGLLTGSVTSMTRNQLKDMPQATGRVAWSRSPGLRLGASTFYGPYLYPRDGGPNFGPGESEEDFMNSGVMADLYWGSRWVDVNAEAIACRWEYPGIPDLGIASGYIEAMYKVRPRWFLAGRYDVYRPNEVEDSSGNDVRWDDAVNKIEYGIGYKPRPRTTIKLVAQHTRFDEVGKYDADLYATQISAAF